MKFEDYEKMLHSICRKIEPVATAKGIEYDDLFQEASVALLTAFDRWVDTGKKPISYFYGCVYWSVREYVNPHRDRRRYLAGDEDPLVIYEAAEAEDRHDLDPVDLKEFLEVASEGLIPRDREVVLSYVEGAEPSELAQKLGCTRANIYAILRRFRNLAQSKEFCQEYFDSGLQQCIVR